MTDPFTEYFQPEAGLAAMRALMVAGCEVINIPIIGSGRTLISKGFVREAKLHAKRVVDAIMQNDPIGESAIVGVEPSEIYTLRDEYEDFFPESSEVKGIKKRAWMIDDFLVRPDKTGRERIMRIANNIQLETTPNTRIILHIHCFQKAQPPANDGYPVGGEASSSMLKAIGYQDKSHPSRVLWNGWRVWI